MNIEIVSATRLPEDDFWNSSALGLSLRRLAYDARLSPFIAFENKRGLPEVFNSRILASGSNEIIVFIHDDVWIEDFFFADRIISGLQDFDVIGIAGNKQRIANQPGWAFKELFDGKLQWDDLSHLSGCIAHSSLPFGDLSFFGGSPAECELLDGVFLAARKSTLVDHQLLFDPQFDFHFYDLDFCRSARDKGLRLGTWPISMTHQSKGAFNTPSWRDKLDLYRKKWE